jgi:hypothetical protein
MARRQKKHCGEPSTWDKMSGYSQEWLWRWFLYPLWFRARDFTVAVTLNGEAAFTQYQMTKREARRFARFVETAETWESSTYKALVIPPR